MLDNLKKIFCFSTFLSIEIDLHNVINRDETSPYFDIPSDITYDEIEVKDILSKTTGNEKLTFTVVLTITAFVA